MFLGIFGILLSLICIVLFVVALRNKGNAKIFALGAVIGVIMFVVGVSMDIADDTEKPVEVASKDKGEAVSLYADLNDFEAFVNYFKDLSPSERSQLYDESIYGEEVTWTGKVTDTGSSQVWLCPEGMDISVDNRTEGHNMYYSFVAKFEDGTPDTIQIGDVITVKGKLTSRGDYDSNYNWKIYETIIIN